MTDFVHIHKPCDAWWLDDLKGYSSWTHFLARWEQLLHQLCCRWWVCRPSRAWQHPKQLDLVPHKAHRWSDWMWPSTNSERSVTQDTTMNTINSIWPTAHNIYSTVRTQILETLRLASCTARLCYDSSPYPGKDLIVSQVLSTIPTDHLQLRCHIKEGNETDWCDLILPCVYNKWIQDMTSHNPTRQSTQWG